ncbi:MAG: cob(I)yrinic acid a,c-diamide adenosyltransferase [Patescibacteria group bacterium]
MSKGLNIYYYGKGKGKTTAVMGLAVRAAGALMNVSILQFVKAKQPKKGNRLQSGEWPVSNEFLYFNATKTKKVGKIESKQVGAGFVGILGDKKQREIHIKAAKQGLKEAEKIFKSKKYQLVILDELISALELKLITEKEVLNLISKKPKELHLAYTGHEAFKKIIEVSDLVSEVKMIKHPYYKGIMAIRGIDF